MKVMGKSIIIIFVLVCVFLGGCGEEQQIEQIRSEIASLEQTKTELITQISSLSSEVVEMKEENGTAKYVLTLEIKQTHFTLDVSEHIRDSVNAIEIQIPVDKEYYDSVEIGGTISDEFRMGSLIFHGSFGNWKITVKDKEIQ